MYIDRLIEDRQFNIYMNQRILTDDPDMRQDIIQDLWVIILKVNESIFSDYRAYKGFCCRIVRNSMSKTGNVNRYYRNHFGYGSPKNKDEENKDYVEQIVDEETED